MFKGVFPVPCIKPPCLILHAFIFDLPDSGMLYLGKYRQNLPFIDSLYFLIDLKKHLRRDAFLCLVRWHSADISFGFRAQPNDQPRKDKHHRKQQKHMVCRHGNRFFINEV